MQVFGFQDIYTHKNNAHVRVNVVKGGIKSIISNNFRSLGYVPYTHIYYINVMHRRISGAPLNVTGIPHLTSLITDSGGYGTPLEKICFYLVPL